jgi:hypothetical protein
MDGFPPACGGGFALTVASPLLAQLSSQLGDRTEAANRAVAALCLDQPALLAEIAGALNEPDAALVGDCAEVLTKVAEQNAGLVAPYAEQLVPLLDHATTRVRWEAMHALALVAALQPRLIARLLPSLRDKLHHDRSTIVRDYAVEALSVYAGAGKAAAEKAFPLLKEALTVWDGKHAARALRGLARVAERAPRHAAAIRALAYDHLSAGRAVTRTAAKAVLKSTEHRS